MGGIEILTAGPFSTIQDQGRFGYQHLGVPISGALDREALEIGNMILGNPKNCSAIEICFGGFAAIFHQDCYLSLIGSGTAMITHRDQLQTQTIYEAGEIVAISAGDQIEIPPFSDSLSALLCVSGGLDVPRLYGSQSTTPNAALGGHEGRMLAQGDRLALGQTQQDYAPTISHRQTDAIQALMTKPQILRILFGPQDYWFTPEASQNLTNASYKILPQTSRMGMRLAGPQLAHKGPADIISDGMIRGAIQVPADGQPIIAMADHGTMGGYTKIACVISADIAAMGRLRPHDQIFFESVTQKEAEQAFARRRAEITSILSC